MILAAYGLWNVSTTGHLGGLGFSGHYLYGRVAPFATCHHHLSVEEAKLCPSQPVSQRPYNQDYYAWLPGSPLHKTGLRSQQELFALAKKFAEQVILHQPPRLSGCGLAGHLALLRAGSLRRAQGQCDGPSPLALAGPNLQPSPGVKVNGEIDTLHVYFANVGFDNRPVRDMLHPSLMKTLRSYRPVA